MKHCAGLTLLFLGVVGMTFPGAAALGQESTVVWQGHHWARFGVGSWKQVRVRNESLNEKGQVIGTSTTETRTTLTNVSNASYTLRIDRVVEVAGKRWLAEPKTIQQGFNGESIGQTVELQKIGTSERTIDGRNYPVEVRKMIINGDELKRVSLLYFSDRVLPHILRRETKATYVSDGRPTYASQEEVVAVDMPYRVLNETKLVSHVKSEHRGADGVSIEKLEVHCPDIPGGVVANSSKEFDATGRIAMRSTLELTAFHVVPIAAEPADPQTVPRRFLMRRHRKVD